MKMGVVLVAGLLTSCAQTSQTEAELKDLDIRVTTLQKRLETTNSIMNTLGPRLQSLEQAGASQIVQLDPAGGGGYEKLDTNVLPLLVLFSDSRPIGDGTRVRLQVGNTSAAIINGLTLSVSYNRRNDGTETWPAQTKVITAKVPEDISPGAWTNVEVSLPGIKPDELGFLALQGHMDSLSLRKAR